MQLVLIGLWIVSLVPAATKAGDAVEVEEPCRGSHILKIGKACERAAADLRKLEIAKRIKQAELEDFLKNLRSLRCSLEDTRPWTMLNVPDETEQRRNEELLSDLELQGLMRAKMEIESMRGRVDAILEDGGKFAEGFEKSLEYQKLLREISIRDCEVRSPASPQPELRRSEPSASHSLP